MNTNTCFHEIPIHNDIISLLKYHLEKNELSHYLMYGTTGSCKSFIIDRFIDTYYEGDRYLKKRCVLKVNTNDERGINMVREDIKKFAKLKITNEKKKWKIIVMEDIDNITKDGQFALRRIMEIYSMNVKFFIVTNQIFKIIPALISRCLLLYLPVVPKTKLKLLYREHLADTEKNFDNIYECTKGNNNQINLIMHMNLCFNKKDDLYYYFKFGLTKSEFDELYFFCHETKNKSEIHCFEKLKKKYININYIYLLDALSYIIIEQKDTERLNDIYHIQKKIKCIKNTYHFNALIVNILLSNLYIVS